MLEARDVRNSVNYLDIIIFNMLKDQTFPIAEMSLPFNCRNATEQRRRCRVVYMVALVFTL